MTGKVGPSYLLVEGDIKSRITSGEYPVGSAIPSTPKLKEMYGVSDTVVRHAVNRLTDEGILVGHPGKAVYVHAMPAEADSRRVDAKALSEKVAEFERQIREVRETLGRLEAGLIDLYGKSGFEYPRDDGSDGPEAAAGRGRG